MSDHTDFLHPDFEPGEFDRVERQLRHALTVEAERIRPDDRLDTILHTAHEADSAGGRPGGTRRWLVPVAAAAAVAAIAGGMWWSRTDDAPAPTPPASSGPSVATSAPSTPSATTSPSPSSSATSGPAATQSLSLPVYFVGPIGDAKGTPKLFREFVRHDVPQPLTDSAKAKAALDLALNAQPYSNTDGYLQPWSGTQITSVTVTPTQITIGLSNGGAAGLDQEAERLALQELVWTAQAAVGRGTIPVRFDLGGNGTTLFGRYPTAQTYNRPPSDRLYTDLAPLWVTTPARDQVLPATKPVVVTGQAIVFEGSVAWQLRQGSTVVASGHTTASAGAPAQGTYTVSLGRLAPGTYAIRVYELSAADGTSVVGEKVVSFSVK